MRQQVEAKTVPDEQYFAVSKIEAKTVINVVTKTVPDEQYFAAPKI